MLVPPKKHDQLYQDIERLVRSQASREAMEAAVIRGEPALFAVDRLLCQELGERYTTAYRGATVAGAMTSEIMRKLGYERRGKVECPAGSRIKAATLWGQAGPNIHATVGENHAPPHTRADQES